MLLSRSLAQILVVLTLTSVIIPNRPAEAILELVTAEQLPSKLVTANLLSLEWVTAELLSGCNQSARYRVI